MDILEGKTILRHAARILLAGAAPAIMSIPLDAQVPNPAEHATELAEQGRCAEAIPLVKAEVKRVEDSRLKRRLGAAGVRCAMALNRRVDAANLMVWLEQQFPGDAEVLFLAVHVYSDLHLSAWQELIASAPDSPLVVQLNAEAFEKQGDWKKAVGQYRILLQREPEMPGVHYRIGRLLLVQGGAEQEARNEFVEELKVFPQNAAAEYSLGELDREADRLPEAIEHFSKATRLNAGLAEAFFGLGRCLLDADRAGEAVAPLEKAAALSPANPTIHFTLATVYQRLGRQEDASREFALQKSASEKIHQTTSTVRRGIAGAAPEAGPK